MVEDLEATAVEASPAPKSAHRPDAGHESAGGKRPVASTDKTGPDRIGQKQADTAKDPRSLACFAMIELLKAKRVGDFSFDGRY